MGLLKKERSLVCVWKFWCRWVLAVKTGDCSRLLVGHTRTNVHRTSDACAPVHIADCWWIADDASLATATDLKTICSAVFIAPWLHSLYTRHENEKRYKNVKTPDRSELVPGVSRWTCDRLTWRTIDWLRCQSTDWLEYTWSTYVDFWQNVHFCHCTV